MSAEGSFRSAFQRLKTDTPSILSKGTPISQNNVAREAGLDPSALKKARFPELVAEIQQWIHANTNVNCTLIRKNTNSQRKKNRTLKQQIVDLKIQRDRVATLLVDADILILQLTNENMNLKFEVETNIHPMKNKKNTNQTKLCAAILPPPPSPKH